MNSYRNAIKKMRIKTAGLKMFLMTGQINSVSTLLFFGSAFTAYHCEFVDNENCEQAIIYLSDFLSGSLADFIAKSVNSLNILLNSLSGKI
jgi:hypothetical protein